MYKTDLEALLRDRNIIRIKPQGYSMYPLFIPGRDEALIQEVPVSSLRRNDVILYRRDQSILVLHRIARITPEGLFLVGDNQSELEGPLREDQVRGKLIAFVRRGKETPVSNPLYRLLSSLWLCMLPVDSQPFFGSYESTPFFSSVSTTAFTSGRTSAASIPYSLPTSSASSGIDAASSAWR